MVYQPKYPRPPWPREVGLLSPEPPAPPRSGQVHGGEVEPTSPPEWLQHVTEEEHRLFQGTEMLDGTVWPNKMRR